MNTSFHADLRGRGRGVVGAGDGRRHLRSATTPPSLALGCDAGARFRAASITKPFTALLAGGLLDLDEATGVWPSDVRVRHLLSHMSGFDCELPNGDLSRLRRRRRRARPPRSRSSRRCAGSSASTRSGRTRTPGTGSRGTSAAVRGGATLRGRAGRARARAVRPRGDVVRRARPRRHRAVRSRRPVPRARRPSGGLVSTAADLLRFGQRLLAEPLLRGDATARAESRSAACTASVSSANASEASTSGAIRARTADSRAQLLLVPDARRGVRRPDERRARGESALRRRERVLRRGARRAARPPPVRRAAEDQLTAYAGRYENSDAAASIRPAHGGLVLEIADEELFVRPLGDGRFRVPDRRARARADRLSTRRARSARQPARRARRVTAAGVAAGHPATAEVGAEILADGGSAADAAVAACLASGVAETVMTGLLGGGHGIYFDAASGSAHLLDCFVAVPSGRGAPMEDLHVPFGEELVHYAVGASSCAVPGVPAGLDALWRAHGRLPWERLVEPALRFARSGVEMPPAHASCLAMLAPVMTLREGGAIYAPGGALLETGDLLRAARARRRAGARPRRRRGVRLSRLDRRSARHARRRSATAC